MARQKYRPTTGRQAIERADRRREASLRQPRLPVTPVVDYCGAQRKWWDGPPPDRLLDDARMEAVTSEYRALAHR